MTPKKAADVYRRQDMKTVLASRRSDLMTDVRTKIRDAMIDGSNECVVRDEAETSDASIQEEIGFALIGMKSETLRLIEIAIRRMEDGSYGQCLECGSEISEQRLRALPFAARCRDCEDTREKAARSQRLLTQNRGSSFRMLDSSSNDGD
jgi:RNA polymerase-binding transcription factor DksA